MENYVHKFHFTSATRKFRARVFRSIDYKRKYLFAGVVVLIHWKANWRNPPYFKLKLIYYSFVVSHLSACLKSEPLYLSSESNVVLLGTECLSPITKKTNMESFIRDHTCEG